MRRTLLGALGLLAAGCYEGPPTGAAYVPGGSDSSGGEGQGASDGEPSEETEGEGTSGDSETGGDPSGPDPDDGGSTGGVAADCNPGWATPWIGSPCGSDADCSYDGGRCLDDGDGFPCGTCTLDCATTCPDADGTPVTYCINGTDVGQSDAGICLSKCDSGLLGGVGCRDGYVCEFLDRFDGTGASGVCIPDEFDGIDMDGPLVDQIDHAFLIEHLGGDPVDPFDYGPDVDSFQLYLDDVGVQHTSALDIVTPYNQAAATGCGFSILLPDRDHWPKIGALALFTDELTELVGEPIFMRNWWRPDCYNEAVGGAAGGDHPDADAVDLDFMSATSRALAQKFLCDTYWNQDIVTPNEIAPGASLDPRLNISVGLGGNTIHLGVLSQGGRRFWYYSSYTDEPDSGSCW